MDRIRTLAAARRLLLEADQAWDGYSETQTDEALAKLEALDGDLLGLDFSTPEAQLLGLGILLIGEDSPNFADEFKNKLFERLRDAHQNNLSSA